MLRTVKYCLEMVGCQIATIALPREEGNHSAGQLSPILTMRLLLPFVS